MVRFINILRYVKQLLCPKRYQLKVYHLDSLRLVELERELNGLQLEQRQMQQQLGQSERELAELQAR